MDFKTAIKNWILDTYNGSIVEYEYTDKSIQFLYKNRTVVSFRANLISVWPYSIETPETLNIADPAFFTKLKRGIKNAIKEIDLIEIDMAKLYGRTI